MERDLVSMFPTGSKIHDVARELISVEKVPCWKVLTDFTFTRSGYRSLPVISFWDDQEYKRNESKR